MDVIENSTYLMEVIENSTVLMDEINSTMFGNMSTTTYRRKLPNSYYPVLISALAASIMCLILTIIVYSKLSEFKNIPGKNLISLSSCLLITYTLLMVDFIFNQYMPKTTCKAMAILTHLSFLSVFMWTNVMSFDIWQTVVSSHSPSATQSRRFKYWKYALYAWIGTVILALPAILVDSAKLLNKNLSPSFATRRCWLNGTPSFLIYFNAPVGVILIANFTFFGLTAKALVQIRKMTERMYINQHRKRFHLYLKLFIIMGMVWISEFIPWITGYFPLYMIAGIVTSLYGVFLFIIFICKRNVFKSLRKENVCGLRCCYYKKPVDKTIATVSQYCRNASQSTFQSNTTCSTGVSKNSFTSSQNNVSINMM